MKLYAVVRKCFDKKTVCLTKHEFYAFAFMFALESQLGFKDLYEVKVLDYHVLGFNDIYGF